MFTKQLNKWKKELVKSAMALKNTITLPAFAEGLKTL